MTLQEVPEQNWRERYTEGQKLRARIIYVDANSKKVSTWCGGPQTECTGLVPLSGSAWSGELQPCLSILLRSDGAAWSTGLRLEEGS